MVTESSPEHIATPALAPRPSPWDRFRKFGRPPRIMGLDVARALAIIGMAGAHMGEFGEINILYPDTYFGIAHGRSSILFAVLAGISIAILSGRTKIPEPSAMPRIRAKLFGRGAVIFLFGVLLELLGVPVAVILTFYGLLYVVVMPFVRMRIRTLLLVALVIALFGPMLTTALELWSFDFSTPGAEILLFDTYPLTVWVPLMLTGLAIGRLPLLNSRVAGGLLLVGAAVSIMAYAVSAAFLGAEGAKVVAETVPWYDGGETEGIFWPWLGGSVIYSFPHSGGTLEIFGSGGFAVAVIGLCLLGVKLLRWPLIPVAALGSMPLTAYSAHLVLIAVVWGPGNLPGSNAVWGWTSLGLIVGCTLIMMLYGRGPLERIVKRISDATVGPEEPVLTAPQVEFKVSNRAVEPGSSAPQE